MWPLGMWRQICRMSGRNPRLRSFSTSSTTSASSVASGRLWGDLASNSTNRPGEHTTMLGQCASSWLIWMNAWTRQRVIESANGEKLTILNQTWDAKEGPLVMSWAVIPPQCVNPSKLVSCWYFMRLQGWGCLISSKRVWGGCLCSLPVYRLDLQAW